MKLTLTEQEMLDRWLSLTMLEPASTEAFAIGREDVPDLRRMATLRLRAWYADLLDTAPPEMLWPEEASALCTPVTVTDTDGLVHVTLETDLRVRRVLTVELPCWRCPASVIPPSHPAARAAANRHLRGGACAPLAVAEPGRVRIITPLTDSGALAALRVTAVVEPSDGTYRLDDRAFTTLPQL